MTPIAALATIVGTAATGGVVAGLWWMDQDSIDCIGGCGPGHVPPGDVTLLVGALTGALLAALLLAVVALLRPRRGSAGEDAPR